MPSHIDYGLRTDLERSVGVLTAIQMVWLVYGIPTFQLTTIVVYSKIHTYSEWGATADKGGGFIKCSKQTSMVIWFRLGLECQK